MLRVFTIAMTVMLTVSCASAYEIEPSAPAAAQAEATPATRSATIPARQLSVRDGKQILSADEPVTVTLDTAKGKILRTRFAGLDSAAAPLVRIFAGKPDATAETSTNDPHYVGTVAFYPLPQEGTFTTTNNLTTLLEQTGQSGEVSVTYLLAPSVGAEDSTVEISEAELIPAP